MKPPLLLSCEEEALHRSGLIQPHGALLVVDAAGRVSHASANAADWFGETVALGREAPVMFAEARTGAASAPDGRWMGSVRPRPDRPPFDVVAQLGADGTLLEFTRAGDNAPLPVTPALPPPDDVAARLLAKQVLTQEIAGLSGYARVLYIRFLPGGDGQVMAETRSDDSYGTYLGLRFPASDIPNVARALYLRSPWRLIPDATAAPVPVLGPDPEPPDLSRSTLRSASPVHCVYLGNMGVRGSLSLPVVVNGVLWAMIACHHPLPREPGVALLEHLAQRVQIHALAVASHLARARLMLVDGLERRFEPCRTSLQRTGDLVDAWPELSRWLMTEFRVDGATLCLGDLCLEAGVTLEAAALDIVDDWFAAHPEQPVWLADHLSQTFESYPLSAIAGVVAIQIDAPAQHLRLYLCREACVQDIVWGGQPEKPQEFHDGVLGIAPRRSFEAWIETRLGHCRPWEEETRLLATRLRHLLRFSLPHPS